MCGFDRVRDQPEDSAAGHGGRSHDRRAGGSRSTRWRPGSESGIAISRVVLTQQPHSHQPANDRDEAVVEPAFVAVPSGPGERTHQNRFVVGQQQPADLRVVGRGDAV